MSLFKNLLKETGNEFAAVIADGTDADISGYTNTGSYALNGLLSGSIFGGMPNNKVTALAGEPSTGKTFYALNVAKQFLEDNEEGGVFYFESESAVTKQMIESRGVDSERIFLIPVTTIQEFRTQAVKILDAYLAEEESERKPLLMILDSLGMLSTEKEVADIAEGKDTRDMTRAQLIRGAFRVLTLKLGRAKVPMLITNHVYDVVGAYVPTKKMGGGCLVAGTKVMTSTGLIDIQDLKIGDKVITLFGEKPITNTFIFNNKRVLEIEFEDGSIVKCSPDHKFLVDGCWVTAQQIQDSVKNTNSLNIEVSDMKGNLNVYREQVYENLLFVDGESEAA